MIQPIFLLAPAGGMEFFSMPSGATYVANQYGLVTITNGSVADELALINAGCSVADVLGDGNVGAETTRAETAEAGLQAQIAAETTRAEGVEAALQTSLVATGTNIYASTAAAQSSDLANGAYYYIPSTVGGSLDLYLKVSSTSSTYVATLPTLIQSTVTSYATVAALLSAYGAGVTLADGQIFICAGRDAAFDSPGVPIIYAYNSADTTGADNAGTIRVDAHGRRYYLIADRVYVDHFGMHAANTEAENNAGWQAALNWCRNGNGVTQGGVAPGTLWLRAKSNYRVSVSGDLTGGTAANNFTTGIYIDGDGPNAAVRGTLTEFAPVLDLSGQQYTILGENLSIFGLGTASCAVMNLALPNSPTSVSGNENGGCQFLGNYFGEGSGPAGGLIVSACDESQLGGRQSLIMASSTSTANGPWAGNGGLPGIACGWVPPTQKGNLGFAGASTTNTVQVSCAPGGFPATNGALVGFPLRKYLGSGIGNSGTYEANYITGYTVSGTTATIAVATDWGTNPVAGTDTIIVHGVLSLYQPLAGTGGGGGATHYRISGSAIGQGAGISVYCTGCTLLSLVDSPYLVCGAPGTQPTACICVNNFGMSGGITNISGSAVNLEVASGGESAFIWACDSVSVDVDLSRMAGIFTELLRCKTGDINVANAGFTTVEMEGGGTIIGQPIFNTNQAYAIDYVRIVDGSANDLGTATNGIIEGHFLVNISPSALAAVTQSGSIYGRNIVQPSAYAGSAIGAGNAAFAATDLVLPYVVHSTTGGSLQPRVTYTLAANALTSPPLGGTACLKAQLRYLNASTNACTCALKFTQGANTVSTASVSVPGYQVLVAELWVEQSGQIHYTLRSGTAILADSFSTIPSFVTTTSLAIELDEDGSGGSVMDMGGVHCFTLHGGC